MLFIYNIFFFFFGMYMYLFNLMIVFDYLFFSLNSSEFSFIFFFDWLSMLFLSVVFLISGSVLLYSIDYMRGDIFIIRFYFLVFLFIISMFMLISMPDLICLMIGWDGLGLVSYCLVIYYQSSMSLSSGYLTLFINRLGDLFLIFCISWSFNYGCWHYLYIYSFLDINIYMFIFLILACLTKSAQFPFSSWLPAAMAAPTPVSSLVHSSTLVTAGVYLMIRFNLFLTNHFSFILLNLSLLTILLSGMGAIYENDLKKIIAFSTMGQLSLMIFIIALGCEYLGFIHLLIHAVFKSLLFLCSGFFIYGFLGVQDIRFMGNLTVQSPLISSCFLISLFSLCGLPFYSGYFSSDFIIELFILSEVNFFYFIIFFFSIYLTLIYCLRIFTFLFLWEVNMLIFNLYEKMFMNISCLILLSFSIIFGSLIFWLIDSTYIFIFDFYFKHLILFFFFYFFIYFNSFSFLKFNFKSFLIYFFSYMWFLPFFSSSFVVTKMFNLSHFFFTMFELGWSEYLMTINLIKFLKIKNFYLNLILLNSFKVYFFSFIFFLLMMFFF
uniref:NADH-ubiquinone oxidoreductase chain 5 n=1 Tax=Bambusiphaga taibaishana TaxID=2008833 RepID=A0A7S4Z0J6_9HEMI|nr:NADH dehydrogenase subunit 5 [Bambusiphaga taibaishana]QBZ37972.1 NADH dehydrogenase subunit 5 [Bambusiphaga taibaishana]